MLHNPHNQLNLPQSEGSSPRITPTKVPPKYRRLFPDSDIEKIYSTLGCDELIHSAGDIVLECQRLECCRFLMGTVGSIGFPPPVELSLGHYLVASYR